MVDLDLRPLSLGEILDRTFSIYRKNFLLFAGIAAIPQLLILCSNLAVVLSPSGAPRVGPGVHRAAASGQLTALGAAGAFVGVVIYLICYLFAQGGTVFALSELYLGHPTTIRASFRHMWGKAWRLLGVTLLNGLATIAGLILLIIPGFWIACRLLVCVPAALLEELGPGESLTRSYRLTNGNAGRSLMIYLLYLLLTYTITFGITLPFTVLAAMSAHDPQVARFWLIMNTVGTFLGQMICTPVLTISTTVFYYDLRVRNEGFDLQVMMNSLDSALPDAAPTSTF